MYYAHSREDGHYQPLICHLHNTANLARTFADAFDAAEWGHVIGLYHDIGKASPGFQKRVQGKQIRVDHSTAGARAVMHFAYMVGAYCIAGHHGGLPDGGTPQDLTGGTLYERIRPGRPVKPTEACDLSVLEEQISPVKGQLPLRENTPTPFRLAMFIRMLSSCLIDADRLDTELYANYGETKRTGYDDIPTLHARMRTHLAALSQKKTENPKQAILNEKRSEIQSACLDAASSSPGLFSLTVPTGGGKTLASLAFALEHAKAHNLKRVIYVIPYVSITEQNAKVFRDVLGNGNVVEHHANFTFDDEDESQLRQRLSTENWDCPVVVTTSVRFFESLFAAKTSQLRKLHNIAQSVVIFDEAQMIPLAYLRPCVEAITELVTNYHCTAVLMSATQPALRPFFPDTLPFPEIMPDPQALYAFFKRVTIAHLGDLSEEALIDQLADHPQALCIVNTRKMAQKLYNALPAEGTFHLSTLMYPAHRRQVLETIKARLQQNLPCRVVATSLVEAGVDLDFPVVYRQEAGLDSVIQAAGRCNREGKADTSTSFAYVFRLDTAGRAAADRVQAMVVAREIFDTYEDPASMQAIEAFFGGLYALRGAGLDQNQILALTEQGKRIMSFPFAQIEKQFRFIDNATQTVVIAVEESAKTLIASLQADGPTKDLLRAIGQYSVNIYDHHIRDLEAAGALEALGDGCWLLAVDAQYDPQMGLKLDVETGLGFYIDP